MVKTASKNQNALNLFLNSYFSIFVLFAVVIVFVLAYFFWLRPKFIQTLGAIRANVEMQQQLYEAQQKKLISLKAVSELYKKIDKEDLKKFNGVLSENYVKERLFGELEEIVYTNGFLIDSIKLSRPDEGEEGERGAAEETVTLQKLSPRIGQINVNISISTIDYTGFKNLVKIMENNLRLFDIVKLDFSPSEGMANFTLATYYYKKAP